MNLYGIVSDQPMSAFEQLCRRFTLADTAFSHQKQALTVDLHKYAVTGNTRSKRIFQIGNQRGYHIACRFHTAQNRNIVLLRHFNAFRYRLNVSGKDHCRNLIRKQLVENLHLPFMRQRL